MRRWALLAIAVLGGTWVDRAPERPPAQRAGLYVLEADLHVHTRASDGVLSPLDVVLAARRAGLDVVAVTEHNTTLPGRMARAAAAWVGGPIVLVGEEITTRDYHLIALGVEQTVPGGLPLAAAILAVKRQRGVAIAAHPVRRYWPALEPALGWLDGAEVVHPLVREPGEGAWDPADLERFYARLVAASPKRPSAIGSSDHHAMNGLGGLRTLVFARAPTAEGALEALRTGRTVVVHPDGRMIGDAELVAALELDPLEPAARPTYAASGLVDAVLRTVGVVGLVVVAFARVRRRR